MKTLLFSLVALLFGMTIVSINGAMTGNVPQRALAATVVIHTADAEDRFLGSGFVFGNEGIILTNAHVVDDNQHVQLTFFDGRMARASVHANDPLRDIAILTTETDLPPGLTPAPVGDPGASVYAIGAPLGATFSLTSGVISAPARQVEAHVPLRLLQHDAAVNPGSSGGPLVDDAGRLLGMNSRIADGSRYYVGLSYAIATADLERRIPLMLSTPQVIRLKLGLRVRELTPQLARSLNRPPQSGILVDHVEDGLASAHSGLAAGDILISAGGQMLERPGDLAFALDDADPQHPVLIDLIRAEKPMSLRLDLSASDLPTKGREALDAQPEPFDIAGLGIQMDKDGQITGVADRSAAFKAGLIKGDRVNALNGTPYNPQRTALAKFHGPVLFHVSREGSGTHILVDPWNSTRRLRSLSGNQLDLAVVIF